MAVAPYDYSIQPFHGTDIVALVLVIASIHCLTIHLRDKEPGMGWFAFSMGLLAVWVAFNRLHLPTGLELNPSPWYYLMCLAMASMAPGLVTYLDVPAHLRRWALGLILAPSLAIAGIVALAQFGDAAISRLSIHPLIAVAFATMGAVTFWAARREPGAGHAWLGLALMTVPGLALILVATRVDPVAMRYWAVLPVILVGLTLPTVSLMRRHRALQAEVERRRAAEQELVALNASLEAAVAQRTDDLQSMVAGLQSFNRSVSHDLRGPLGGMAGLARLADQALVDGDDSVARRALPAIATQAETSARLVAALLDLAHVGDAKLDRQCIDPARIANEVIEQLRLGGSTSRLPEFVVHPMPTVDADPELLRAVLTNLIGNAVKFTCDRADAKVEVAAGATNGTVCLQVRDNGIGFEPQHAASMFAPFRRLHGNQYEGHGIGLSIVRRAVERHGGKVWAEASPGQGACFSFTLPRAA